MNLDQAIHLYKHNKEVNNEELINKLVEFYEKIKKLVVE